MSTFSAPKSFPAGSDPFSVAAVDLNGDGKPDLAVADYGGGVDVLLGNGDGTFGAATSYAAGDDPTSVAVADLNGDGKPDLAVADYGGGVDVLLGNGDGTFGAATSYAAGSNPDFVTVADVNGDGNADLVVADFNGGVDVLLNNGNDTFSVPISYAAGSNPDSVAVADVNGDGKPDLVVADFNGGVDVLLNNGNGTFSVPISYAVGIEPESVAVADLNGDGKPDIVVADASGDIDVLLNNGNGTFGTATSYAAGGVPYTVAVADVNGDGKPDIVVANGDGDVDVLLGNGDGTFQSATSYPAGSDLFGLAVADLNGDGKPDVAAADDGGNDVDVLLNENIPCFCRGTLILTPAGEVPVEELRVGDRVTTSSGAAQPVVWIGSGRSLVTAANPHARPVIVRRGALADNVPRRDLHVTGGHSLFLDGVLVPAEGLVNGRSIVWDEAAQVVEFYHVELARHDVLVADGAPAESYKDDGNRHQFHNADRPPGAAGESAWCAPVLRGGVALQRIWRQLLARSGFVAPLLTGNAELHLLADGRRLDPIAAADGAYRFRLDRRPAELRLCSRSFVPCDIGLNPDRRRLGVALCSLALRGGGIDLALSSDAACLTEGFHQPEASFRWTDGNALVPSPVLAAFDGPFELTVTLAAAAGYPLTEYPLLLLRPETGGGEMRSAA